MCRIALCLEHPLHQQGGVEVLVCSLIENLHQNFELFLVSEDSSVTLNASPHGAMINGHFQWNPVDQGGEQIDRLIAWSREQQIALLHFHFGGTFGWNASSWNCCAITELAKCGFRCLSTNHQAIWPFDKTRKSTFILRRLASFLVKWPGKARQLSSVYKEVLVSDHDFSVQCRYFPLHRSKFIRVYHSRLNASDEITPLQSDNLIILNLATIAFRKGQHILVEAFALIAHDFPDWHLHLIGYEGERACAEKIQQVAADRGLTQRIHITGATNNPAMAHTSASIYVQPSLLEGLGLSLQEAMFHGKACVGSDQGGIPELIHNSSVGIIFPSGDATALAEILARLIANPALRQRLGKNARASILDRGMTCEAMVETYHKLYHDALTE